MTDRDYTVRGCTALLDAIGGAIHHIGNVHRYARPEDVPEHTMFIITTDGMENASRRYNSEKVKQMIERQKAKYGWEFLFLGANIDAVETASQFGIGADRAVNYQCDSEGTALNYDVVSEAISSVRWTSCFARTGVERRRNSPVPQAAFYGDWGRTRFGEPRFCADRNGVETSPTSRAFVSRTPCLRISGVHEISGVTKTEYLDFPRGLEYNCCDYL